MKNLPSFYIEHRRSGAVTKIKARCMAEVWRMLRANGGEPTHYKQLK